MPPREASAAEARLLTRHLLGVEPSPPLVERYVEATQTLLGDPADALDRAICAAVLRRPWTLGPLDAALGWSRPQALLRRKLVVMAAILETTPEHEQRFEALAPGPANAVLRLTGLAGLAAAKALCGFVLIGWLRART